MGYSYYEKKSYGIIYWHAQQGEQRVRITNSNNFVIRITKWTLTLCLFICSNQIFAELTGSLSEDGIAARLKPLANVTVEGAAAAGASAGTTVATTLGPKDIFEQNCKMCHQTGIAGAPKFGNKDDWAPRIAQGVDTLVKAALSGIRAMPPRGNCIKCTDEQIKETVEYMINAAK
jgi:cytochrome c5